MMLMRSFSGWVGGVTLLTRRRLLDWGGRKTCDTTCGFRVDVVWLLRKVSCMWTRKKRGEMNGRCYCTLVGTTDAYAKERWVARL